MGYSSKADIERAAGSPDRLIQLLDRDEDGTVDTTLLERLIDEVDRYIDSYLAKRYAVPVEESEATELRRCSADLVVYRLRTDKRCLTDEDREIYEEHRAWLEGISFGRISLGASPLPAKNADWVTPETGTREEVEGSVTREKLRGFW